VYIGVKTIENLIKNPLSAYHTLSLQVLYSIARVGVVQRSNAKLADLFLCVLVTVYTYLFQEYTEDGSWIWHFNSQSFQGEER
jgi:hypothetical protein